MSEARRYIKRVKKPEAAQTGIGCKGKAFEAGGDELFNLFSLSLSLSPLDFSLFDSLDFPVINFLLFSVD